MIYKHGAKDHIGKAAHAFVMGKVVVEKLSKAAPAAEAAPAAAPAGPKYDEIIKDLKFRSIGPAVMGGRVIPAFTNAAVPGAG